MILLDSNIFIIDRFFRQDDLYPQNRAFVEQLAELTAAISVFTLIETVALPHLTCRPESSTAGCISSRLPIPYSYSIPLTSKHMLQQTG